MTSAALYWLAATAKKWLIWTGHLVGASVPYVAILMGAIYRDECPANRNIPLHLIVSGVVTALLHLSTSIDMHRKLSYLRDKESQKPAIFSLLSLFLFIWMILGELSCAKRWILVDKFCIFYVCHVIC